jgi:hypothetical protein
MKCRTYDAMCINHRFCRAHIACCAGDMKCVPLSVDDLSAALDEACDIALEWIQLGIPDDDAQSARFRIQSLMSMGTGRSCTCSVDGSTACSVHPADERDTDAASELL